MSRWFNIDTSGVIHMLTVKKEKTMKDYQNWCQKISVISNTHTWPNRQKSQWTKPPLRPVGWSYATFSLGVDIEQQRWSVSVTSPAVPSLPHACAQDL